jgi:endoglucanase
MRRVLGGLVAGVLLAAGVAAPASAAVRGFVRVDQAGYAPGESKTAYLMTSAAVHGAHFAVTDAHGHTVLRGRVGATSRGRWNTAYAAVYPIDLSALHHTGTYRLSVSGVSAPVSPPFRVQKATDLYGTLVRDGVTFYRTQTDSAHHNDRSASVYATPAFVEDDIIAGDDLTKIGGPVDVYGGWFDAGDYLKFTHTTAYGVITLEAAARAGQRSTGAAARYGVDWLDKMWDQRTKTLYQQVGIGSGNEAGTFAGDHDLWRLPQADDHDSDPQDRYVSHRPVFRANQPGRPISPNLAGRVSAAFALAAQTDARSHPARAREEYRAAVSLYRQANLHPTGDLVTALPFAFYPEDTWHDDMELGAAEIALATQKLHLGSGESYVADGLGFAAGYIKSETGDTFNLYDVSALAHADLIAARHGAAPAALVGDLRRQVRTGATRAAADAFSAGAIYTDFDADSHAFGLIATEALYEKVSGDRTYAAFATRQRDWLLGANAWGTSFMAGEGTTFPRCPQHQIANLTGKVLVGAVVNGPNNPSQFADGLGDYQDGMVPCPADGADPYGPFSTTGSRFVDDVRAWQTDEPALDMTGSAIIGAALQASLRRTGR